MLFIYIDPLAFLRTQPQFQQMRSVIQQNPDLLNAVLEQIGQTNPALLQLISQNQEAFVNMLNEPVDVGSDSASSNTSSVGEGSNLGGTSSGTSFNVHEPATLSVSEEDREAIERVINTFLLS